VSWVDKTDAGQAWAAEMQAKRERSSATRLHIVMGPQFAEMVRISGETCKKAESGLFRRSWHGHKAVSEGLPGRASNGSRGDELVD